jgi:hypothetical protein
MLCEFLLGETSSTIKTHMSTIGMIHHMEDDGEEVTSRPPLSEIVPPKTPDQKEPPRLKFQREASKTEMSVLKHMR